ncbi:S1 family peptidase [Pseudoflavitalea rhizosphaerae]|uniref:S1 family peptidase n=1 Tax=Pseudoflavitalea rhizosphaerae TaxID=1884793 RepID=UPI0013E0328B|nr:serine protease [Pseudoflavitalea rhizosphaerae]
MIHYKSGNQNWYTLWILVLLMMAGRVEAQVFTNDAKMATDYLAAIDSILAKGATIQAAEAQKALEAGVQGVMAELARPAEKVMEPANLYEYAKKATVITGCAYLCPRCTNVHLSESSGYIIDPKGIMVTNYHVAATYAFMKDGNQPKGFFARLADGRTYAVKAILASSRKDDLAILQLETNGELLPALALGEPAKVGDKICVLGHPQGMHYFLSQGHVTNKYLEEAGAPEQKFFREMMCISADYATGSSGGPVMDIYGNVVGTVSNTRMLLHSNRDAGVQMVVKNTVPVESLWKLIRK